MFYQQKKSQYVFDLYSFTVLPNQNHVLAHTLTDRQTVSGSEVATECEKFQTYFITSQLTAPRTFV